MIARSLTIAFGIVAASVAVSARADEDVLSNSVRLGYYYVMYDTHADDIKGPFVPAGVNLKIQDVATPYFAYVRRLTNHFSVELAVGAPPLTKTEGKGPAKLGSVPYNGQVITTARWLAPTATAATRTILQKRFIGFLHIQRLLTVRPSNFASVVSSSTLAESSLARS